MPYNPYDRAPGESAGDSRIRQREIDEKWNNGGRGVGGVNTSNSGSNVSFPGSGTVAPEPVEMSNFALYVGMPLLFFAFLIWLGFLPFAEVQIFGYPLATVSFCAGLLCAAFRYMVRVAGILLIGAGGIGIFGMIVALIGGVPFSEVIAGLVLSGAAIGIGMLIIRASMREN